MIARQDAVNRAQQPVAQLDGMLDERLLGAREARRGCRAQAPSSGQVARRAEARRAAPDRRHGADAVTLLVPLRHRRAADAPVLICCLYWGGGRGYFCPMPSGSARRAPGRTTRRRGSLLVWRISLVTACSTLRRVLELGLHLLHDPRFDGTVDLSLDIGDVALRLADEPCPTVRATRQPPPRVTISATAPMSAILSAPKSIMRRSMARLPRRLASTVSRVPPSAPACGGGGPPRPPSAAVAHAVW